jgi:type IV pilus assembly protein PilW
MRQATDLPALPADAIPHIQGNYTDLNGSNVLTRYNAAAGLPVAYSVWDNTAQTGGRVFDFGPSPSVLVYSLNNNQLVMQNLISNIQNTVAEDIIQLQAQYGRDTTATADGTVDVWDNTVPATADAWSRVLAMRIAVAARSSQFERPDPATGVCNTTTAAPVWSGGTLDVSADASWMCYRYKVFETVVPLRNQIWMQP